MSGKNIRKSNNIVFEIIEGEGGILYNTATKETHLLNETAFILFELCNETNLNDVFNKFHRLFSSTKKEVVEKDFNETINALLDKNIEPNRKL